MSNEEKEQIQESIEKVFSIRAKSLAAVIYCTFGIIATMITCTWFLSQRFYIIESGNLPKDKEVFKKLTDLKEKDIQHDGKIELIQSEISNCCNRKQK